MEQNQKIPTIYRFGEFQIDTTEEILLRVGKKTSVNRRTFQVLRLLVERQGEIVTKQEFFDTVWADTFVEDNSLTVAITTLRKVLGDDAKSPKYIENLPRKGYRFIGEVTIVERPPASGPKRMVTAVPQPASRPQPLVKSRAIFMTILSACLLFMAVILAFDRFGLPGAIPATNRNRIDSIAVLPFHNDDPEIEYLSDGLADSLINSLRDVPNLRVIDRNSAFQYKGKEMNTAAIAKDLNVRAILAGNIIQSGDRLTVRTRLTETQSGQELWTKEYESSVADALTLHNEMVADISGVIADRDNKPSMRKGGTDNREAYNLYLNGIYKWNKRTPVDINSSCSYFQQAIDKDPTFALAFIGLARCYAQMNLFPKPNPSLSERVALVKGASQMALEIDSSLGEAYSVMGLSECYFQFDLTSAEQHHRKAVELSPKDATAHHWYAEFLAMQGQFDQSFREYDLALDGTPLSSAIRSDRARTFYYARQYDRAIEELEKVRLLEPDYERIDEFFIPVYEAKGMFAEAVASRRAWYTQQQKSGQITSHQLAIINARLDKVAVSLHNSGADGYWRGMINFEIEQGNGAPSKWYMAMCHSKLGETEKVFPFLEQSIRNYDGSLLWMKVAPDFDNVRDDPRFVNAMHRVGFK